MNKLDKRDKLEHIMMITLIMYMIIIILTPLSADVFYLFKLIKVNNHNYILVELTLLILFSGLKKIFEKKLKEPYNNNHIYKIKKVLNIFEYIAAIISLPLLYLFFV